MELDGQSQVFHAEAGSATKQGLGANPWVRRVELDQS